MQEVELSSKGKVTALKRLWPDLVSNLGFIIDLVGSDLKRFVFVGHELYKELSADVSLMGEGVYGLVDVDSFIFKAYECDSGVGLAVFWQSTNLSQLCELDPVKYHGFMVVGFDGSSLVASPVGWYNSRINDYGRVIFGSEA